MTPRVFLLCTCRNPDLLPATTMVFQTLRTGFPTAEVVVRLNGRNGKHGLDVMNAVSKAAATVGAKVVAVQPTTHQDWVESLVDLEEEPFYIVDTDMAFWTSVEDWEWALPMAGRWIPEFYDPWSKMMVQPRLHTSLLYIDPVRVRAAIEEYQESIPDVEFMERPNLFASRTHPVRRGGRLMNEWSDTCALLSAVVPGQCFHEGHLACYDHLNAGTWLDVVGEAHPGLRAAYDRALVDVTTMRGLWRSQEKYYAAMAPLNLIRLANDRVEVEV